MSSYTCDILMGDVGVMGDVTTVSGAVGIGMGTGGGTGAAPKTTDSKIEVIMSTK